MCVAYWISPENEILPVAVNHIGEVIRDPARFGYTRKRVVQVYKKHQEKLGIEGTAREKIIRDLVCRGWIRLRRYENRYWSVTVNSLNQRSHRTLSSWATRILKTGIGGYRETDKYMPVRIVVLQTDQIVMIDMISKLRKGIYHSGESSPGKVFSKDGWNRYEN